MLNLYKNVLNAMPTAAIVLDDRLRVRFANEAFCECFSSRAKKGSLKEVINCDERVSKCGTGIKCAYCSLRNLVCDAHDNGGFAFRKLIVKGKDGKNLAVRMKIRPLGKYYLGIVDNTYETQIGDEMVTAQNIQQRLLPSPARSGALPYSFMYIPCREIGGDMPDVYEVGGDTVGVIADVSGKGISAGMLSAFVKAGWDRSELSPARSLKQLSKKFNELNPDERSYITVAAVRVDRLRRELHYSIAGHNAPILIKSDVGIDEIEMNSPPISNWIPDFDYQDRCIGYRTGDILVLITDGVTESKNDRGEMFSLERVERILQHSINAEHFIDRLKAGLSDFCGGTFGDDITAMAFDLA